jgi:signal transduction histidine kinase
MVTAWATAEDQPLLRSWRGLPVLARDAIVAGVLAPVVWHPGLAQVGVVVGELDSRSMDPLGHGLLVALWLPLAVRRRWPALSLAVIGGAYAVHELLGYPVSAATLALFVAGYSVGAYQRRFRAGVVLIAGAGYGVMALLLARAGSPTPVVGFLTIYLALAACWGAGAWIRARQASAEDRRRQSVDAAITAERSRIARELHDVVTHHVTAMVVQADAARFLVGEAPEATRLSAISDTGRLALADLRHLLGVLGSPGDGRVTGSTAERTPVVGPVSELVEQARHSGQPVQLMEDGEPPASPGGAELAAYRVVQEALTNAIKHAPGRPTSVRIRHTSGETELEILTGAPDHPASVRPAPGLAGGGRGLTGMRERVAVFGGDLIAGPTADGGFQVLARIPRESAA